MSSTGRIQQNLGMTFALKRVWLWTLLMAAYSALTLFKPYIESLIKSHLRGFDIPDVSFGMEAALTFVMGMLILFRINRAYERWWEARTLWGTLVNVSRNLAVKTKQLADVDAANREDMRRLIVDFCHALKDHLRGPIQLASGRSSPNSGDDGVHIPSAIVQNIYKKLKAWSRADAFTREELWMMDSEARMLLEICGACERIKSTLMSRSWRLLTRQCLGVYLLVAPWALVDEFNYWTIPLSALIAYFVIGGEGIAHYVEEPFGLQEDHLDLDGICDKIEVSVGEILSD